MNSCATGRRIHGLWKCFEMEGRIRGYGAVTGSTDRRRWRAQTAVGPRTGTATRSLRALMGSGGFDTPTQSHPLVAPSIKGVYKICLRVFRRRRRISNLCASARRRRLQDFRSGSAPTTGVDAGRPSPSAVSKILTNLSIVKVRS